MKKMLYVALASALLAGCATTGSKTQTPAQIAAVACPSLDAAVTQLHAMYALQPAMAKQAAQLATVQPEITAACAVATATSLQQLATVLLPELMSVATTPPLTPTQVETIDIALVAAQVALQGSGAPAVAPRQ